MKRLAAAVMTAALVAGCGSGSGDDAAPIVTGTPTLPPIQAEPVAEVPAGAAAFGTGGEFAPGIGLTAGIPEPCDMSEDVDVNQLLECVAIEVTVANSTGGPIGLDSLKAEMTSGGQDAGGVSAPGQGIVNTPELDPVVVEDGDDYTFTLGFAVEDSADLTLDIGSYARPTTFRWATPTS